MTTTTNPLGRWPRSRQRERVLQLVRQHEGAVDAPELAAQTGLHVTTVRFHLDTLCEQGVVARTRIKRTGVGRPRTGYVAAQGRLDYQALAEILGRELGETDTERQQRAESAGRRCAAQIVKDLPAGGASRREHADSDLTRGTALVSEVFHRMGFAPELGPVRESAGHQEQVLRLRACPVSESATVHPELSCAVHLGLLRGLLSSGTADRDALHADMDPVGEPGMCVARVTASPHSAAS